MENVLQNMSDMEDANDIKDMYSGAIKCEQVSNHVHECNICQRRLSFDPVEKALLKTHSVKNEIIELIAYIATGVIIIVVLHLLLKFKSQH